MTNEEIRRDYDLAKDKKVQVGILADLTGKSRNEIREIVGLPIIGPGRKPTEAEAKICTGVKTIPPLNEEYAQLFSEIRRTGKISRIIIIEYGVEE